MEKINLDLTLEKARINERLRIVEIALTKFTDEIQKVIIYMETNKTYCAGAMGEFRAILKKHEEDINGNGHVGMKTQIDRLVINEAQRRTHLVILYTAIVGLLLESAFAWFKNVTFHGENRTTTASFSQMSK